MYLLNLTGKPKSEVIDHVENDLLDFIDLQHVYEKGYGYTKREFLQELRWYKRRLKAILDQRTEYLININAFVDLCKRSWPHLIGSLEEGKYGLAYWHFFPDWTGFLVDLPIEVLKLLHPECKRKRIKLFQIVTYADKTKSVLNVEDYFKIVEQEAWRLCSNV